MEFESQKSKLCGLLLLFRTLYFCFMLTLKIVKSHEITNHEFNAIKFHDLV